ncbi:MAG: hypothetical protein KDJ65_29055 [Anaerolineae bacterium]|nr:hypothetical protein [Anaerolineae bacterium]
MQFEVGDFVVHPVYRMGHITAVEKKKFSELEACRYYQIAFSNSTLWIPVAAQDTVGLRLVTTKSDLDQYRDLLKSPPVPRNNTRLRRKPLDLMKRLKQGSFLVMCEVVRDLTLADWKKPLGATTKTILRKTQKRLSQEWAMAADISIAEANQEIDNLLQTTQKGR